MDHSEIELRNILAVLMRQSRVIGAAFALTLGLAGLYLLTVTPTFTATALVLVDPQQKNLLDPATGPAGSAASDNARVDSEVEILRSDAVALAVIGAAGLIADPEFGPRLGLAEKLARAVGVAHAAPAPGAELVAGTLERLQRAVTIRRRGLTHLIAVSASSADPARAAELANELAGAYIGQQVQAKIAGSLAARDALREQIELARDALARSEAEFENYLDDNIARIATETGRTDIADLHGELAGLRQAMRQETAERSDLQRLIDAGDWTALSAALGDQALRQLDAERQALAARLAGLAGEDPATPDLSAELAALESAMQRGSDAALAGMAERIGQLDRKAARAHAELRERLLGSDMPPDLLAGIYTARQEADIARSQYQTLLARRSDAEAQARMQLPDARIVSPALAPARPGFPDHRLVLLAALALAGGLGVGGAFLKEYYIGGVTSAVQLSELVQAPAGAALPWAPERKDARFGIADRIVDAPLSLYAESVRKLRATIDQAFRATTPSGVIDRGRVILVSSARAGEGKTTTALALARTYALAGKRTLLIDADLRNPSVHSQLGFAPDRGFLDYLRDPDGAQISASFYARDPATPLALLMGAGRSDIPTDQLLNSATFEALLDQARDVYDLVILDSPPLLPIVDARYIAHNADAVVLVAQWASTSQNDLRAAVEPLRAAMKPEAPLVPALTQQRSGAAKKYDAYSEGYTRAGTA